MVSDGSLNVLFNCTTNVVGGGVQNAANFIKFAIGDNEIKFFFAVSPQVDDLLTKTGVSCDRFVFHDSPARSLSSRKRLNELAKSVNAKLVYTMAGPAYVRFPCFHVLGMSEPYVTHSDWQGFLYGRSFVDVFRLVLTVLYKMYYSRFADFYIFQTESSRLGFCRRLFVNKNITDVVPNSLGSSFFGASNTNGVAVDNSDKSWVVFCPGAAYPHKAFDMIPAVAKNIKEILPGLDFKFVLTIQPESDIAINVMKDAVSLGVSKHIENIGPYSYSDAFGLYAESDIVFIPSVLEVFSTSYLEAVFMKKPLVCADKDFSKEICEDGAYYFPAGNSLAGASVLIDLINNYSDRLKADSVVSRIIGKYGSYVDRFSRIRSVLMRFLNN